MGGKVRMFKRGNNYYAEPLYKIPENLTLKIVLLALIARWRNGVDYATLERYFRDFCPHPKAYDMMVRYIVSLYKTRDVDKVKRGVVIIQKGGWRKLKYYDVKVGLPEVLREPIKDVLEEINPWSERRR